MSIKYVLIPKGNPSKPEEPKKFYANAKSDGEVNLKKLCKEIAEGSTTVSDSDVLAVLNDLTKYLRRHLAEGQIVRFGDFGSFQVTLSSDGAETEDMFNHTMIRGNKIAFRPGVDLKELLNNLKYEKTK